MGREAAKLAVDWYSGFQEFILGDPRFEALRPVYPFSADQMRDFNLCHEVHYNAIGILQGYLNDDLNEMLKQAFHSFVTEKLSIPSLGHHNGAAVSSLDQEGYCLLPSEDANAVSRISNHFTGRQIHIRNDDGDWVPASDEEARNANTARYERSDILLSPDVMAVASRPEILSIVEQHLGVVPTLINLSCWRSPAGLAAPKEAQFHHFDLDDYRFCKLFIYLSDAGVEAGPHVYVRETHRADVVRSARDAWPEGPEDFMNWYLKSVRKTDEDVEKAFGNKAIKLTGVKGDRFITNTAGIHKGELPKSQDRFLLQMEFAATPMLTELDDPVSLSNLPYPTDLKNHLADPAIAYVTRLFVG